MAADSTGGHTTLQALLGVAIVLWGLASVTALLAWGSRVAGRHRPRRRDPRDHGRTGPRRRRRRAADNPTLPAAAPATPSAAVAIEHVAHPPVDEPPDAVVASKPRAEGGPAAYLRPPAIAGARCSPETLEPLADELDASHRLAVAEARVADTLAHLPSDRWLVERYVVIAGHRIPFLILGETGVFAVWALSGPPIWDELPIPSHVAAHVTDTLPGYGGPVQVGLCRALAASGLQPRWWCRPGEPGAWVMGSDWLIRWLEHFGPAHGLGVTDLERLRELAVPKPGPARRTSDVIPDLR
jgi:hypothetical protein